MSIKFKSTRHEFAGFGGCESACDLDYYLLANGQTLVMATERQNPGTSITNKAEDLATEVFSKLSPPGLRECGGLQPEDFLWVEHYPAHGEFLETFDKVEFVWQGGRFRAPRWSPLKRDEFLNLIAEVKG